MDHWANEGVQGPIHRAAAESVQRQYRYIAVQRKAPLNAARWFGRLRTAVDGLAVLPRGYSLDVVQSAEHGTEVYRMGFERTYLLFYTVTDDPDVVEVVSFHHGARESDSDA